MTKIDQVFRALAQAPTELDATNAEVLTAIGM
jgi:hypothetical protein